MQKIEAVPEMLPVDPITQDPFVVIQQMRGWNSSLHWTLPLTPDEADKLGIELISAAALARKMGDEHAIHQNLLRDAVKKAGDR